MAARRLARSTLLAALAAAPLEAHPTEHSFSVSPLRLPTKPFESIKATLSRVFHQIESFEEEKHRLQYCKPCVLPSPEAAREKAGCDEATTSEICSDFLQDEIGSLGTDDDDDDESMEHFEDADHGEDSSSGGDTFTDAEMFDESGDKSDAEEDMATHGQKRSRATVDEEPHLQRRRHVGDIAVAQPDVAVSEADAGEHVRVAKRRRMAEPEQGAAEAAGATKSEVPTMVSTRATPHAKGKSKEKQVVKKTRTAKSRVSGSKAGDSIWRRGARLVKNPQGNYVRDGHMALVPKYTSLAETGESLLHRQAKLVPKWRRSASGRLERAPDEDGGGAGSDGRSDEPMEGDVAAQGDEQDMEIAEPASKRRRTEACGPASCSRTVARKHLKNTLWKLASVGVALYASQDLGKVAEMRKSIPREVSIEDGTGSNISAVFVPNTAPHSAGPDQRMLLGQFTMTSKSAGSANKGTCERLAPVPFVTCTHPKECQASPNAPADGNVAADGSISFGGASMPSAVTVNMLSDAGNDRQHAANGEYDIAKERKVEGVPMYVRRENGREVAWMYSSGGQWGIETGVDAATTNEHVGIGMKRRMPTFTYMSERHHGKSPAQVRWWVNSNVSGAKTDFIDTASQASEKGQALVFQATQACVTGPIAGVAS